MRGTGQWHSAGPAPSAGFTLLEVLVAFLVFALAFGAIMQILSGSIRNTARSAEYTQAALWAESKMETLGVEEPLEEGSESGDFNDDYRYELNVEPYEYIDEEGIVTDAIQTRLLSVELVVRWNSGQRERSARFRTLKAILDNER